MIKISTIIKAEAGSPSNVIIKLDAYNISKLFVDAFEGWCPVCQNHRVNEGETICCDCLREAVEWHERNCVCCPATYTPKETR